MDHEERNRSKRGYQQFKAIMHIGMGSFYIAIAALLFAVRHFGAVELPSTMAYVLGAMMLLYGIFRIWRGIVDIRNLPKRDINRDFPDLTGKNPEN
jgi:hypothetical protein